MTKHTIEIKGLPEGWEPVAYRYPTDEEDVFIEGEIRKGRNTNKCYEQLIVKKTKPREITLVETDERASTTHFINTGDVFLHVESKKIWRIKEE